MASNVIALHVQDEFVELKRGLLARLEKEEDERIRSLSSTSDAKDNKEEEPDIKHEEPFVSLQKRELLRSHLYRAGLSIWESPHMINPHVVSLSRPYCVAHNRQEA